ncbi:transcription factor MCM1 NDAI_0B01280 [Naumovozyma dairenensis CBS 421]|uniref:MADS-box domain-containing protein n=1 Tax=Naumovozyma dairenensis (strain ATCC 10597 / BCRC 20456 / CBS 421 / NBRC 0211 / NRRL Y-12639) TaxID=1071378 RepID=G0W5V1_NAUDC|nr:hypothetical protein NDAI_0B01280 [Naumovozyma dairenensis CBS 421]CCD23162.1 hypothetical protein NDAI_0B01280 [Naumovozyma dairenensis CBS 421]
MSDVENTPEGSQQSGSTKERRKIEIKFIENKTRRHVTFSKRKHGIMKKAFELSVLTGTQVLLLVVSETGLVYTFSTPKFEPIVTQQEGRNLIQACLNAPDEEEEEEEEEGEEEDNNDHITNQGAEILGSSITEQDPSARHNSTSSMTNIGMDSMNAINSMKQAIAGSTNAMVPPGQLPLQMQQVGMKREGNSNNMTIGQTSVVSSSGTLGNQFSTQNQQQLQPTTQQQQQEQQQQHIQQQRQQQQQQQGNPATSHHYQHGQGFPNTNSPYLNAEQNAVYQQYFDEQQQNQF